MALLFLYISIIFYLRQKNTETPKDPIMNKNEPGPSGDAPPATPTTSTFTQADIDRIISERVAAAVKPFDGIDPKEFKKLQDAESERQRKALEAKGSYEKIISDQKAESEKQIAALRDQLNGERIKSAIEGEAVRQNAISPTQVRELLKSSVRVNDSGAVEVLDADGKPAFKAGVAVTVSTLVEGFLKENAHFVSANPPGGGSKGPGYGGGNATMTRAAFQSLSPAQRLETVNKGIQIVD